MPSLSLPVVLLAVGLPALAGEDESAVLRNEEERGRRPVEASVQSEAPHLILSGATVMTANGTVHDPGWIELKDGRIAGVGAGTHTADGARVVDVSGFYITPGLIDTHSHLGVYPSPGARAHGDGNEATAPTTPGVWAEHSFWPQDPGLERAIAGGITTLQILPGSANLVGGRGVTLHIVPHRGSRAMRFPGAPETVKMACGENPKRVYGEHFNRAPSTRMGNLRGQRQAFLDAEHYLATWQKYVKKHGAPGEQDDEAQDGEATSKKKRKKKDSAWKDELPPQRDLDLETLAGVLQGRILPQIHCYRADDMLSMIQLSEEFGFQIRGFHHALEAYKIRDILADKGISASTWADWWGFKLEAYDGIPHNAALLHEAGGRSVIHSDSGIGIQRLNQEAAKAYYTGLEAGIELTEDDALTWVTLNPAWTLGIDNQVGTLEAGKRADVVVWDAHPFSVYAKARWVFVDGVLQHDVERPQRWSDFEVGQEVVP